MRCVRIKYLKMWCSVYLSAGMREAKTRRRFRRFKKNHERKKEKKQSADGSHYIIGCITALWPDIKESKEKEGKERRRKTKWLFRKGISLPNGRSARKEKSKGQRRG